MLARGKTVSGTPRTVSKILLVLVLACVVTSVLATRSSTGELPTETTNPNATKTVTWNMTNPAGLDPESVAVGGGQAALDWVPHTLAWSHGADFTANGSADENLTANATGLRLRANWSDRLQNANFTTESPWVFTNGTTGNVSAAWDPAAEDAHLWHASPSSLKLFDSMDVYSNWTYTGAGVSGTNYEVSSPHYQGSGCQAIMIGSGWSGYHTVALLRSPVLPVNWSGVDRLLLWFKMNSTLSVTFNVSAQIGTSPVVRSTPAMPLVAGEWQLLKVDLGSLASADNRSNLQSLKLQLSGTNVPDNTWFYFDALTTGQAKVFNETSSVSQSFAKNATTPSPGSAYVSFDWNLENATGATWLAPTVSLGGWSSILSGPVGSSHTFSADVSAWVAGAGSYAVGFSLQVGMNESWAANVSLRIDDVAFVYPDRHNGTYLSKPLSFGTGAEYLDLVWSAANTSATQVRLRLRSGDAMGTWGAWSDYFVPGPYPLFLNAAPRFQINATLSTANASLTPVLESLVVTARSHPAAGSLTSDYFNASAAFLHWRSFNASVIGAPNASVSFKVIDASMRYPVQANSSLAFFSGRMMRWQAVFNGTDGLHTAILLQVRVSYDYQGPPVRLVLTSGAGGNVTAGTYVDLTVVAYDAGSHIIPSSDYLIDWHTTDPEGYVYNNGMYHAVTVGGPWNITASVHENPTVSATIQVHVLAAASTAPAGMWALWPYLLAVLGAAVVGIVVYEVAIRRMYAIDDVFLIAKDGRLIVHNTRRMRADRDEDILSGMLTAITSFLRDQDPEENGELKRFEVGGKTTLLERGRHVYLTAIYSGRVPGWAGKDLHRFMRDLEARFGDAFAHWTGSPEDLHGLKEFMGRFVARSRYHGLRGRAG